MSPSRRAIKHENNRNEIKAIALQLLADKGPNEFSLASIARTLDVTTPALYRYFNSRDELLTEIIHDAYLSFTESMRNAVNSVPDHDHTGKFRAIGKAYHGWAMEHPEQYNLMLGTRVPGYHMNGIAKLAADENFLTLFEVIDAADRDGKLTYSFEKLPITPELIDQLNSIQHQKGSYSVKVTYLALASWSFIHGITSLDLNRHYSTFLGNRTDEFIDLEIDHFIQSIGLA